MPTATAERVYNTKTVYQNNKPVNVLHIIKSLGRGGAETLLAETLNKHNKKLFNFHYIYFLPWKNQMVQELRNAGGRVVCLQAKTNVRIMLSIRHIIRYIRENEIRLIHCHLPISGIAARISGMIAGVPVIYTEHNKWERYHKITYWLNKLSFSRQQKVIAVSGEVERSIKRNYHGKFPEVKVIANGVDTHKYDPANEFSRDVRREFGIPPSAIVIGTTCVFRSQKRMDRWLEIAAAIHERHKSVHFIIVGDGVLHHEIHAKADSLNTASYVHFAGLQPEVRPFLKAMDIFMMCSDFEGLPIALLEAMSMECMPACTDAGGIVEVIRHNENGMLVPVDAPLQLEERIDACLTDRGLMQRLKRAARETVIESYGMSRMVNHIETLYHATIKRGTAR